MKIVKTGNAKFLVTYENPDGEVEVNFNSLIEWFNLKGHFVLLHYQGVPNPGRMYGIYDSTTDSYHAPPANSIALNNFASRCLQVDERMITNVKPTAAILFADSILEIQEGVYKIRATRGL